MIKIILFDLDGPLTLPRQKMKQETVDELNRLLVEHKIGIITGSPLKYILEQCPIRHKNLIMLPCNGTQRWEYDDNIKQYDYKYITSMKEELDNYYEINYENLKGQLKRIHHEMMLDLEVNGEIIQERDSMINFCPIGRDSNKEQREAFVKMDKELGWRNKWLEYMNSIPEFKNLRIVLGGQTSFDIYPYGWDKSYIFNYADVGYDEVSMFFGNSFFKDGNDECMLETRITCFNVQNPEETVEILKKIL